MRHCSFLGRGYKQKSYLADSFSGFLVMFVKKQQTGWMNLQNKAPQFNQNSVLIMECSGDLASNTLGPLLQ